MLSSGKLFEVFAPPWYRFDRWAFWAWVLLSGRERAVLEISSIEFVVAPAGLRGLTKYVPRFVPKKVRAHRIGGE